MTAPKSNNSPKENAHNVGWTRITLSLLFVVLFIICCTFILFILEGSLIRACQDVLPVNDASACLPDANQNNAWSLDPAAARFPFIVGVLGGVVAGFVALIFLLLLPAELIKIDGTFKQGSNQLRVGGVAAVFLLITAGGGYLAYRAIPAGAVYELAKADAKSARETLDVVTRSAENNLLTVREQFKERNQHLLGQLDKLRKTNDSLVLMISNKHQDYARALLDKGYFTQMRGSFVVFCDVDAANTASDDFRDGKENFSQEPNDRLSVLFPAGQASNPDHVNFGVPMSRLGSDSFTFMTLKQDAPRDLRELMRTELSMRYEQRENMPDTAYLYLRNVIHQGQLADYCNRVASQGTSTHWNNSVRPLDAPPTRRGG